MRMSVGWVVEERVTKRVHPPGVEPGARPWEDPMLPLHHECLRNQSDLPHINLCISCGSMKSLLQIVSKDWMRVWRGI